MGAVGVLVLALVVALALMARRDVDIPKSDFRRVVGEVLRRVGTRGMAVDPIVTQFALETGYGSGDAFKKTLNLGSIHAIGGPTAYWDGTVTQTGDGPLRTYKSLDAAAADYVRMIAEAPHYREAYAWGQAGDAGQFFRALKAAGYATDPVYVSSLSAAHKRDGFIV